MEIVEPFNLNFSLIIHFILSIYYFLFIIKPLAKIEQFDNSKNYGYDIFVVRIILLAIINLFSPTLAVVIDVFILFLFSFTLVARINKKLKYLSTKTTIK